MKKSITAIVFGPVAIFSVFATLYGCASAPVIPVPKDDRVIVVYPPEAVGSKTPINISYNGQQSNNDGTEVNYNGARDGLQNGITYK